MQLILAGFGQWEALGCPESGKNIEASLFLTHLCPQCSLQWLHFLHDIILQDPPWSCAGTLALGFGNTTSSLYFYSLAVDSLKGWLDSVSMCVCEDFPIPTSNSQTPAGCPRIQLDSDTLPRDGIRFHRYRARSYKTTLHFRCQLQAQVVTCASEWQAANWRFWWLPPWFGLIFWNGSLNSGKSVYSLDYQFIIKGH